MAVSACLLRCVLALYVGSGKGRVLRGYLGAVFGSVCSFVSLIAVSSLDLLQLCVCVCYILSNSRILTAALLFF